jgi:hypothetical protein
MPLSEKVFAPALDVIASAMNIRSDISTPRQKWNDPSDRDDEREMDQNQSKSTIELAPRI